MSPYTFFQSVFVCLAFGLSPFCLLQANQPALNAKEEELTCAQAKESLLKMMRSKAGKEFGWFGGGVANEMAKMPIVAEKDGWYAWTGVFRFNPSKATYAFVVRPRPDVRACAFEYEGSFVRKDEAWFATLPKWVSTALQSGK